MYELVFVEIIKGSFGLMFRGYVWPINLNIP